MIKNLYKNASGCKVLFLSVLAGFFFLACSNPVDSDSQNHVTTVGYELEIDGGVLVRYFRRQYEFDPKGHFEKNVLLDDDISVGGSLIFRSNDFDFQTGKTDVFTIHYLDESGERIVVPEYYVDGTRHPDGEWYLEFEYLEPESRSNRLEANQRAFEMVYDYTKETWQFQIRSIKNGRVDVRINLFHLDHPDLTPIPLPISIDLDE